MRNRTPDGKTFQEIMGMALEARASEAANGAQPATGCVMGEVLDTHNPHLPGRVFVRWLDAEQKTNELWLQAERHLKLRKGDRVILMLPVGWSQWIVTGALGTSRPLTIASP